MKKNKLTEKKRTLALYIIITAVLVILAALLGYHLTKRYKETITETYNTTVSNITEKFYDVQGDVADGISRLEESVEISQKSEEITEESQTS